jgi:predicted DNA-binding transcriptional regulator AlpA
VLWQLVGPDSPLLTRAEVCAWLGVSPRSLARLVAEGRFPPGLQLSPGGPRRWLALDCAAYLHLRSRSAEAPKNPSGAPPQEES